jgi:type III secretion system YscQ/HrcQ family protein
MRAAPYPYERWPKLSRSAARVASGLARIALHAEGGAGSRAIAVAATALGTDVHVAPGPAHVWNRGQLGAALPEPLAAVIVALRLNGLDHNVVLELSTDLCGVLGERVLGGDGANVRVPSLPLDELELGVLGYLAARAVAASGGKLRVCGATAQRSDVLDALAEAGERVIVWPLELSVGEQRGSARALLSEHAAGAWLAESPPPRRFDVPSAWVGLPIQLCAHAATVRLTMPELAALEPGDIVVPERTALARGTDGFHGSATLHALGGSHGRVHARCSVATNELRIEAIERGGHAMNDDEPEALVKDAPIEVCVELARFTVRLEDVLGLRVGEVWSTGNAIGERVALTANGRTIARGELVDIDGEIGVRILEKNG